MAIDIRPITADEFMEFMRAEGAAFGQRPADAELEQRREYGLLEPVNSLAAFEDGKIVGTAGALPFELTLPGGALLPVRGVSWVSVLPTHRRRGILTALMRRQLDDVAASGEPLTMLTASESGIYGRFGYGIATTAARYELERPFAALAVRANEAGRIRLVEIGEYLAYFTPLYDRLRRRKPGMIDRPRRYWEWVVAHQYPASDGAQFFALYEDADGKISGVAQYQVKNEWLNGLSNSVLTVRELLAETTDAHVGLWRYCLGVDLVRTIRTGNRHTDDPIRWMLAEPRRLRVAALVDDLYVRILDVPAALAARRYAVAGSLVLEVADGFRPRSGGRYRLTAESDGAAACVRSNDEADIALSITDLGAAYLGGVSFVTLAEAGRVEERIPGALARADALFAVSPAPYCGTPF